MTEWYFWSIWYIVTHFWQLDLGVSHISKLPTLLSVETGRVHVVGGIAPVEKCGEFQDISTEDEKASWELLGCWNPWFRHWNVALVPTECQHIAGCPFLDLLIHDPTHLKQKRSHWEHWEAKGQIQVGFSKWLVPTTFGFLRIIHFSFVCSFWKPLLAWLHVKTSPNHLTISHSSPKRFAPGWSVAGNHHPQEVWWRSLHHWQVPQGRLLLVDLNQSGGNQQSTASKVYFQTTLNPLEFSLYSADFGRDYLDQSLPSTIGSGSTTFLYHAGPHGWEMDQCIRCREALRVGMLNAVNAW